MPHTGLVAAAGPRTRPLLAAAAGAAESNVGPRRRGLLAAGACGAFGLLGAAAGFARAQPSTPAPDRAAAANCGDAPAARGDGWAVAAPGEAGLDGRRLCAMAERLENAPADNVHAVLVARRGRLVFERYFAGEDQRWGRPLGRVEFGPDTLHDLRSVTKTVVALLVGIAIGRGHLEGVDEPVTRFFPEHADLRGPERDRIRLRHLLTMTAGLAWDEFIPYSDPSNSERQMSRAPDPYRYALEQPVVAPPGELYAYSGGATALLAAVLHKATGRPLDAFAKEALFDPLEAAEAEWIRYPSGHADAVAASGLRLRPRDMAKLGQLFLSGGVWNGRRVVPAAWIAEAATPRVVAASPGTLYGYQVWLGRSLVAGREVRWAGAMGLGGQRVFVVPEADLVVATTAGLYASGRQGPVTLEILNRYVLPALA
jgi:CubicO group peptidase (beta-lactamase class C family)